MKLGYNFTLEQSQKLIMTPELRQAIEILQFNSIELKEYLSKELEENPMLEKLESINGVESIEDYDSGEEYEKESENEREGEIDWKEYLGKLDNPNPRIPRDKNLQQSNHETFISNIPTLNDHLIFQLSLANVNEGEYGIGKSIIQYIDDNGYLQSTVEEIAKSKGISMNEVEKVLEIIQKFDPSGVGARSLKECLLIQLNEHNEDKNHIRKIVENHLEDLGHNRMQKIARSLKIDIAQVQKAANHIKRLEPKPGRAFSGKTEEVRYVSPDAEIKLVDGEYKVILNDITGPRLNINNYYKNLMATSNDNLTIEFLNNRFDRAMWVIRSIEQRRTTIRKVIESILKFQMNFFIKGEKYLKPLTLKEVAEDIEMHESTVSRTTSGKYVQTPRGLFELKYFFSSGLLGRSGDISSTSTKSIIKSIIEEEDKKKPYSDQKIAELLKLKGVSISRRTVAKYRDELEIPSSSMRRRF